MDATAGALIGIGLANVATLLTLVLKTRADNQREIRHRQWQIEDRTLLAAEVKTTSVALADKVENASTELARRVEQSEQMARTSRDLIVELLQQASVDLMETKKISTDALHEANGTKQLLAEEVKKRNDLTQSTSRRADDRNRRATDAASGTVASATTQLAEQTGVSAAATGRLADKIEEATHAADTDARTQRNDALAVAGASLLVEIADRSKNIEKNTKDTADEVKRSVDKVSDDA